MPAPAGQPFRVPRGHDRFDEHHDTGNGVLSFKLTATESQHALVIAEIAHHTPGGPPRHIHPAQDEWFYVAEGHYVVAVGDQQFELRPGDSAFGPRGIPHTWAYLAGEPGRMMFVISPALKIEEFLRTLGDIRSMAPQEPAFWQRFGMELVGPPIPLPWT